MMRITEQRCINAAIAAMFFVLAAVIPAAAYALSDAVRSAQRLMVAQKYPEATAQVRAILKTSPNDIDAIYTLAAIEQTRILDYESYTFDGRRFQVFADSLLKILEKRQTHLRGADSLRCLFYRANILGGVGLMQTKRGAWIEGARTSMASQNLYRQVKKIDPGHLGADMGLGVFDYYFATSMKWIPFVASGGIEKGLEALERSLNAPFPFNSAAKSSYCWILIDRKQYKRADSLASSALAETPGSTIFLRIRAHVALWSGNNKGALHHGKNLKEMSRERKPINWSDLSASYYIIASAYDKMKMENEANAAASEGLGLKMPEAYRNMAHIKEHVKHLKAIKK
jgi:hypothetical protein